MTSTRELGDGERTPDHRAEHDDVRRLVAAIKPFDDVETTHRTETLAWIDSGAPLWRTAKPATPPQHLVAYTVVVDPGAQAVLLVDHRLAGRWLPAGGHVERGEHPADAARRELAEELGIDPEPHPASAGAPLLITRTTTVGPTTDHLDVTLWFVFCHRVDGRLRPDDREFAATDWWPMAQVNHGPGTRFDPHLPRFLSKLAARESSTVANVPTLPRERREPN